MRVREKRSEEQKVTSQKDAWYWVRVFAWHSVFALPILLFMVVPLAKAEVSSKIGVSPWEERAKDVWEAQITDGKGTLIELRLMDVPSQGGRSQQILFFKVTQKCFDKEGRTQENIATLQWMKGEFLGRAVDCGGHKGLVSTPPAIEDAIQSYPPRVACILGAITCRQI